MEDNEEEKNNGGGEDHGHGGGGPHGHEPHRLTAHQSAALPPMVSRTLT